jgi:predicted nucleic-acid-binding protein
VRPDALAISPMPRARAMSPSAAARKAIFARLDRGETLMICAAMFLELEWVLRSRPDLNNATVISMLRGLTEVRELAIDHAECVVEALYNFERANVDFAVCLFHATDRRRGCSQMLTFDRCAQKALPRCVAP